jgi:hypothetical protein
VNRVQHHSANHVLAAPPGATIEECTPLAVTVVEYVADGTRAFVSYWQPTPDELALIAAGRPVRLMTLGSLFPPVIVGVEFDGMLPEQEGEAS